MSKIIIENRTDLPDVKALDMVRKVMEEGRVSNNGKQYCYLTSFTRGYMVSSDLNKKSDRIWL